MARTKAFNPDKALRRAIDIFWTNGYEATSMADLVAGMGLSRSSIYETFGSKRDLYLAALAAYEADAGSQKSALAPLPSARAEIARHFELLLEESVEDAARRGCLMVNTAVELGPHDAAMEQSVLQALGGSESWFVEQLRAGVEAGEFSAALDVQAIARFLLNASCGLRVLTKAGRDEQTLREIIAQTLRILD